MRREWHLDPANLLDLTGKATVKVGRIVGLVLTGDPTAYQNEFGHLHDVMPDSSRYRRVGAATVAGLGVVNNIAIERLTGVNPVGVIAYEAYGNIGNNSH